MLACSCWTDFLIFEGTEYASDCCHGTHSPDDRVGQSKGYRAPADRLFASLSSYGLWAAYGVIEYGAWHHREKAGLLIGFFGPLGWHWGRSIRSKSIGPIWSPQRPNLVSQRINWSELFRFNVFNKWHKLSFIDFFRIDYSSIFDLKNQKYANLMRLRSWMSHRLAFLGDLPYFGSFLPYRDRRLSTSSNVAWIFLCLTV